MVHITIDTEKDSASAIQHVIALLQEELAKKNDVMRIQANNRETEQNSYNTPQQRTNETNNTPNPFDMFGSGLPSSGGIQPTKTVDVPVGTAISEEYAQPQTEPTNDLFGAFDNEPQSQEQKPHIVLEAPPRKESSDFENSSLFAKQVSAQDLINDEPRKQNNSFFKNVDEW